MKSNLQAFDAMTVMVQYLSEDVGTTVLRVIPTGPASYDFNSDQTHVF